MLSLTCKIVEFHRTSYILLVTPATLPPFFLPHPQLHILTRYRMLHSFISHVLLSSHIFFSLCLQNGKSSMSLPHGHLIWVDLLAAPSPVYSTTHSNYSVPTSHCPISYHLHSTIYPFFLYLPSNGPFLTS